MKITIELDGLKPSASAAASTTVHGGPDGDVVGNGADGGAGPGAGDRLSPAPASGEADGGGPGQTLLDVITAAEAAGLITADTLATNGADAGAGPSRD